jgi:hypothetical protein
MCSAPHISFSCALKLPSCPRRPMQHTGISACRYGGSAASSIGYKR